jgi:hypothetical protein
MHYAWAIARGGTDPATVPARPGVNIGWVHRDAHGAVDLVASRRAAEQMVVQYGMRHQAALHGRHMEGRAIDMTIQWSGDLHIRDADGRVVTIRSTPRDGTNPELHAVGRTFGVRHFVGSPADPPHWSDDGH